MIVECAIVSLAAVVITAVRSAERIHRRQLEADALDDVDVAEARRVLERDRKEWACCLTDGHTMEHRIAATCRIGEIDAELLRLAGAPRR